MNFTGSFLVNDPSQTRTAAKDNGGTKLPDFAPVRDEKGRPFLPASSFRGVLRSRAEMILRTIRGDGGACHEGLGRGPCRAIKTSGAVASLCPACRLFGNSGWKSPLSVLGFALTNSPAEQTQDFLRIDRFTGSGANHLKFDGRAAIKPVYTGKLRLDLGAARRAGALPWAIGLLALVLRDMAESEVPVGFGAGKGFGRMALEVTGVRIPPESAAYLFLDGGQPPLDLEGLKDLATLQPDAPLGKALDRWIQAIPTVPTPEAAGGGK